MVTLNKIYTRTGDDGSTGLVGGIRVKKSSHKVSAYGDVDELNCHLGVCTTLVTEQNIQLLKDKLFIIQNELFDIGAELATPPDATWPDMPKATQEHVTQLERWVDELNRSLPTLNSFILPGGTMLNAQLHVARAVCRRAERSIVLLQQEEVMSASILQYINRLSDLLFVMARVAAASAGALEYVWVPRGSRPVER